MRWLMWHPQILMASCSNERKPGHNIVNSPSIVSLNHWANYKKVMKQSKYINTYTCSFNSIYRLDTLCIFLFLQKRTNDIGSSVYGSLSPFRLLLGWNVLWKQPSSSLLCPLFKSCGGCRWLRVFVQRWNPFLLWITYSNVFLMNKRRPSEQPTSSHSNCISDL